jgi:uncharacterized protein YwgA
MTNLIDQAKNLKDGKITFSLYEFGGNKQFKAIKISNEEAEARIQLQEYDKEQLNDMIAFIIHSFKLNIEDIKEIMSIHNDKSN